MNIEQIRKQAEKLAGENATKTTGGMEFYNLWDKNEHWIRMLPPHPQYNPGGLVVRGYHKLALSFKNDKGEKTAGCGKFLGRDCYFCDRQEEFRAMVEAGKGPGYLAQLHDVMRLKLKYFCSVLSRTGSPHEQTGISQPSGIRALSFYQETILDALASLERRVPDFRSALVGRDLFFYMPAKNRWEVDEAPEASALLPNASVEEIKALLQRQPKLSEMGTFTCPSQKQADGMLIDLLKRFDAAENAGL